tara:strand:+ start:477 stop:650 length:174 start_codon:yes stop_codon:yes gene_type:complete
MLAIFSSQLASSSSLSLIETEKTHIVKITTKNSNKTPYKPGTNKNMTAKSKQDLNNT